MIVTGLDRRANRVRLNVTFLVGCLLPRYWRA